MTPKSDKSPLWLTVEFVFRPLPWNWRFSYFKSDPPHRDLSIYIGPFALVIIDG